METPATPRPSFHCYAIIDVTTAPPALVGVEMSRSDAREKLKWREDSDALRIRRARLTMYES